MRRQHVRPGRFDPLAAFVGTTPGDMYGHTGFDEPIRHTPAPPRAEDRGVHSRGGKGEREQRHDLLQPPLVELLDHEPAANRSDPEAAEGQAGGGRLALPVTRASARSPGRQPTALATARQGSDRRRISRARSASARGTFSVTVFLSWTR